MNSSQSGTFRCCMILLLLSAACASDKEPDIRPVPVITGMQPASGPRYTVVTLTGSGFTDDINRLSVYMNGKQAPVLSATPTSVRFEVPPKAGDGPVSVSVNGVSGNGPHFDFIYTVTVSTFSGTPMQPGNTDGPATSARFHQPAGLAIDRNNNLYVADELNHVIRKVAPDGSVSTFCGSGLAGHNDGSPLQAMFHSPTAVACDSLNNFLYVADRDNHCIRKLSFSGTVLTVAGIPAVPGYVDAPGNSARFQDPAGVAVLDESGKVYVTDGGNHCVRMINEAGVVSTFAGTNLPGMQNGSGTAARFSDPHAIAANRYGGYLIVADRGNHNVRRIYANGNVTTVAGITVPGFTDGPGSLARFNEPLGVCSHPGELLVGDAGNHRIRFIDETEHVTTLAGNGTPSHADGQGLDALFNYPKGIVRDSFGNYYIADSGNHCIRKMVID